MKVLVTGGAGFIGSNFIRYLLENVNDSYIVNLDNLTYAGNLENLKDVEINHKNRYTFIKGDICDKKAAKHLFNEYKFDFVLNFAAESHVDRSIDTPEVFLITNILGTQVLLNASMEAGVKKFIQISTDEVYGSLGNTGAFTEVTPLAPNSPYSASKAAADLLVRAFNKTYGFPGIITRCSNNYGPYQFPEKLIPLLISNALENRELPIYGDGKNIRDWIFVSDHCSALSKILDDGKPGEIYNIGGNQEKMNIDVAKTVLKLLKKPESLIKYVKDRPGHDKRYAIDSGKIQNEIDWTPSIGFDEGIRLTIDWYVNNEEWIKKVKNKEYLEYYEKHYKNR
jgi:dTDP-glucose 4,6-dehydratase